jgi:hypothetical protein
VSPDQVFAIIMGSITAWTVARIFRGPLGEALARRIGGTPEPRVAPEDEQVAELQARLAELEERLDFAERLLARGDVSASLPRGTP